MAGVRRRFEFTDFRQQDWRVDIWDANWNGSITTETNGDLEFSYPGEGDMLLGSLKTSSAKLTLFFDGSGSWTVFRDALIAAQEDQFRMVVYRDTGSGFVLYWAGVVVTDMIEWDNDTTPTPFMISAVDGLARLKDIDFSQSYTTGYAGPQTIKKIIFDILAYNNTAQFWSGASVPYMAISVDWYDTQQTLAVTQRIFEAVRISGQTLIEKKSEADDQLHDLPMKAYDVLQTLLKIFAARIVLSEGSWHIQQVANFTSATYTQAEYNYLGAYTGNSTVSNRVNTGANLRVMSSGVFGYYPTLKTVKITAAPSAYIIFPFVNQTLYADTPITGTFQLGTVRAGAGSGLKVRISTNLFQLSEDNYFRTNMQIRVEIQPKFGTNRINSPGWQTVQWTTTAADKIVRIVDCAYYTKGHSLFLEINTPEIPFTEELNCTLEYSYTAERKNATIALPSHSEWSWNVNSLWIALTKDDKIASRSIFYVDNPTTVSNSIELDLGEVVIVDTGVASSNNIPEIQTTETSGIWKQSGFWNTGFAGSNTLIQSVALEAMGMQSTPKRKYMGPIEGIYAPHKAVGYDGTVYVCQGVTFRVDEAEWSGEWFGLLYVQSNIAINDTRDFWPVRPNSNRFPTYPNSLNPPVYLDKEKAANMGGWIMPVKGNEEISGGSSQSTFAIESSPTGLLVSGDVAGLLHEADFTIIDNIEIDADVNETDTSLTIVNKTFNIPIPQGARLFFNPAELLFSKEIRGETFFNKNFTAPTSDSDTVGKDGDFGFSGDSLYWRDSGTWYKFTGATGW